MFNKRIPIYKTDTTGDQQLREGIIAVLRKYPFTSNTIVGVEAEDALGRYDFEDIESDVLYQMWVGTTLANIDYDPSWSGVEGIPIGSINDSRLLDPTGEADGSVPTVVDEEVVWLTANEFIEYATEGVGVDYKYFRARFQQVGTGKITFATSTMNIADRHSVTDSSRVSVGRYLVQFNTDNGDIATYNVTHIQRTSSTTLTFKIDITLTAAAITVGAYVNLDGLAGSDISPLPTGQTRVTSIDTGAQTFLVTRTTTAGTISVVDFQALTGGTGRTLIQEFITALKGVQSQRFDKTSWIIWNPIEGFVGYMVLANVNGGDLDYTTGRLIFETYDPAWVLADGILANGNYTFEIKAYTDL